MINYQPSEMWKRKINQLIDNELPSEDIKKLKDKAAQNPELDNFIQNEIKFREMIRKNIRRAPVSPDLEQKIHSIPKLPF
ncbi:MAG: hypothetical protein IPM42_13395 [Saprospiraceae bacterium]|nr:hypothetical protein [Saprospiraceae bacterium]